MSAQYRNLVQYKDGTVCGEYNAKNEMGGYVGFKSFMVPAGKLTAETSPKQHDRDLWCSDRTDKHDVVEAQQLKNFEAGCVDSRISEETRAMACQMAERIKKK